MFTNNFVFIHNNIQSSYKIHTTPICLWITSFNAHKVHTTSKSFNKVSKLGKLKEDILQFEVKTITHQWNKALWNQQMNSPYLVILFYGFQRLVSRILGSSLGNGFDLIKYNMCCLIIQYC